MEDMILAHHGVDGQEWGKRKYQYEDGSLTPLGRIHYGVGEARDRAKIKMREEKAKAKNEIRIAKAKAKAEAYKIKAEAKAYKERKNAETRNERERIKAEKELEEQRIKADKEVESKKIEAERDAERDLSKENREISKREAKTQVELAEIANEGKEEKKLSTAGKVALGILATAGVGYLLYKTVSGKGDVKGVSESAKTKAQDIVNNNKDTSAKDLIDKTKEKSKKIADEYYFTPDGKYVRAESRGNKISDFLFGKVNHITTARSEANKKTQAKMQKEYAKAEKQRAEVKAAKKEARKGQWKVTSQNVKNAWDKLLKRSNMKHSENEGMVLIHSEDICHHGIKGQKWGVIRKLEDSRTSGRTQTNGGSVSGATKYGEGMGGGAHQKYTGRPGITTNYEFTIDEDEPYRKRFGSYAPKTRKEYLQFVKADAKDLVGGKGGYEKALKELDALIKKYSDKKGYKLSSGEVISFKDILPYYKEAYAAISKEYQEEVRNNRKKESQNKKKTLLETVAAEKLEAAKKNQIRFGNEKGVEKAKQMGWFSEKHQEKPVRKELKRANKIKHSSSDDMILIHSEEESKK